MNLTAFSRAERYLGIKEIAGPEHHPLILWWHSLCSLKATTDEVAWCSAFANGVAWDLRLPRSYSALARSWLGVGHTVSIASARVGYDVVILKRGAGAQPGPENLTAPGHVGFFAGVDDDRIHLLGGNQNNEVSVAAYDRERILGIRRLLVE